MWLVGHPVLAQTLDRAPYAALHSRIQVRVALKPVVERERFGLLIAHALKAAGCQQTLLADSGLEVLRQASKGLPRQAGRILCTAMRLAMHKGLNHLPDDARGPVLIADLAEREKIPHKFLETILLELKNAGVLKSKKGKGGGYSMARPPEQITSCARSAAVRSADSISAASSVTEVRQRTYAPSAVSRSASQEEFVSTISPRFSSSPMVQISTVSMIPL